MESIINIDNTYQHCDKNFFTHLIYKRATQALKGLILIYSYFYTYSVL